MTASDNSLLNDRHAALARELAAALRPPRDVARDYGVDEEQLRRLLDAPWFAELVREGRREWESARNTEARIRIKARMAVEESLPVLFDVITDPSVAGHARIGAFRELREIADVVPRGEPAAPPGASLPPITIVFGPQADTALTINGRQPLDEKPALPTQPDL